MSLQPPCAVMANEDVDEAHAALRPLNPFPVDGPSGAVPLSQEAATPDLPRTPPHGEGHLPAPESLGHLQILDQNSSGDREASEIRIEAKGLISGPLSSIGSIAREPSQRGRWAMHRHEEKSRKTWLSAGVGRSPDETIRVWPGACTGSRWSMGSISWTKARCWMTFLLPARARGGRWGA
jgi:hypothetical protein